MTPGFHDVVMDTSGEADRELIDRGTIAVLAARRDRLTTDEARDIAVQFPAEIKPLWTTVDQRARQEPSTSEASFYERVMRAAGLAGIAEARWITLAVFAALKRRLNLRAAALLVARLPDDLRPIWIEAQPPGDDHRFNQMERRMVDLERRVLELEKTRKES